MCYITPIFNLPKITVYYNYKHNLFILDQSGGYYTIWVQLPSPCIHVFLTPHKHTNCQKSIVFVCVWAHAYEGAFLEGQEDRRHPILLSGCFCVTEIPDPNTSTRAFVPAWSSQAFTVQWPPSVSCLKLLTEQFLCYKFFVNGTNTCLCLRG